MGPDLPTLGVGPDDVRVAASGEPGVPSGAGIGNHIVAIDGVADNDISAVRRLEQSPSVLVEGRSVALPPDVVPFRIDLEQKDLRVVSVV